MSADQIIPVPDSALSGTHCDRAAYEAMSARALADPDGFWREQIGRLDWFRKPTIMGNWSWDPVSIRWFEDGELNASVQCLDRQLARRGDQVAIVWEADSPDTPSRKLTYRDLHEQVCRMANVLKKLGVTKGERVTIYMPMIPEAAVAMLACARIGAVHSVVFGGFSPDAIAGRIQDCDSRFVITADAGVRGGRPVPLKVNVDKALDHCPDVKAVLCIDHMGSNVAMTPGRDHWWHELRDTVSADCPPERMNAEDPLFILYTSGSTGKPKGVLHTTGGYMLWTNLTFHYVFDYREGEL
ncbi:MAG: AMP-binding protein, partial [Alphaproteobacteria bacterium]|nr:AMP-binding protein [Alphaproteobacteria bacterium]